MIPPPSDFLVLDAAPLAAVVLAAFTLALLGSFLVLQRQAMIGDAMAHSVLPGLVIAFVITGSRAPAPMFMGALGAALFASLAIAALTRYARVEPTAAIGVVFTTLFALGVLLVETTGARNVDLDLDCVLSGQLELLFWPIERGASPWSGESLDRLPQPLLTLATMWAMSVGAVLFGWRLLRATLFDRPFTQARGLRPGLVRGALLLLTTSTVVASFEALGSILVIALLTCPPAAARLLTRTLGAYVALSAVLGASAGLLGYAFATRGAPILIGGTIDASGSVAAAAGLILAATAMVTVLRRPVASPTG
ncbi:Manganese transport system membrane protein MntB [Planctomycetes bacterium Poly30]|uniref:Manganese transport system membrane protein MntB n=1 Tax=Saltatorellus ferox TaxID=2528018 RepID=A0A518ELF8_9BACT|nr:Manganese transport system membrane protein MntB [Planctomycetes bacterium Poly30]